MREVGGRSQIPQQKRPGSVFEHGFERRNEVVGHFNRVRELRKSVDAGIFEPFRQRIRIQSLILNFFERLKLRGLGLQFRQA